ncbi:MAG: hypothetical protein HDT28_06435 [Clostridiales bacterium]|nr:hypothetical protein [Clostridiales bacterium]
MNSIEHVIIDRLKQVCGLTARLYQGDAEPPAGEIVTDEERGVTVFAANAKGKPLAFEIDGCSESEKITAALAREFVQSFSSRNAEDPVKTFLIGDGEVPQGIRIGKSDYYVFAVFCKSAQKALVDYLSAMSGVDDFVAEMSDGVTAFCKCVMRDDDYQSAGEFASVLFENLTEEIKSDIKLGVGGVAHGTFELPQYYAYAEAALVNGTEFDPQNSIYSYKEYALIKTLSGLSAPSLEKYVKTVLDKNYRVLLADEELMTAADAFIKHSLNISEASRSMFVHRNTLIYRLDKIEKLTGLNIRNFNDAMTFRVACLAYKMI